MDRDIRTYFLFIGLPALLITAAGLFALVFGVRGIASEMRHFDAEMQLERYERNIKSRMATKLRKYLKTVRRTMFGMLVHFRGAQTNFRESSMVYIVRRKALPSDGRNLTKGP